MAKREERERWSKRGDDGEWEWKSMHLEHRIYIRWYVRRRLSTWNDLQLIAKSQLFSSRFFFSSTWYATADFSEWLEARTKNECRKLIFSEMSSIPSEICVQYRKKKKAGRVLSSAKSQFCVTCRHDSWKSLDEKWNKLSERERRGGRTRVWRRWRRQISS